MAEVLAARYLLEKDLKLTEEDVNETMLERLEKVPGFKNMDLDEANRFTETPEGIREMAILILIDALKLKEDDVLRQKSDMMARKYLSKFEEEKTTTTTTIKRGRKTREAQRDEEERALVRNPDRLPGCQLSHFPIFNPVTNYSLEQGRDIPEWSSLVLVHKRLWNAMSNLIANQEGDARMVIELVTWDINGNPTQRMLVRPNGAHTEEDESLILTSARIIKRLTKPYVRLTPRLCQSLPNIMFLTLRFYGNERDRESLKLTPDALTAAAQGMLDGLPGVIQGQVFKFPNFTLRVQRIRDENERAVFMGQFSVFGSDIPYEIEYETPDPFLEREIVVSTMVGCSMCGIQARHRCEHCKTPFCSESCHTVAWETCPCI